MTLLGKRIAILLILAGFSLIAVAQKQHFHGQVLDKVTHTGIPNVNISVAGTKLGCTTNQNGEFSFYTHDLPVNIIVSHLGFETRRIRLDNAEAGVTILLEPAASMLQEVEIKAVIKPELFFKDDKYSILDYEVDSSLVYLLIYRFRLAKSELLCKSLDGDTVARSGTFSFKPTGLFLDCLGSLHVLSQDSVYQVSLQKDTLILPYVFDIQKFYSTLFDCAASTDEWLIFRKESSDHLTVDFYRIHRKTSQKEYLASVRDEAKMQMLRRNPSDYYFLQLDTIPDGNRNMAEWAWVKKILYKPNSSVLYKIGDTLTVFNTTNGSLDLYDLNGWFNSGLTIPIQQTGAGDWTKEIYFDDIAHVPYTSFLKNGKFTLYRIDLNTGELKVMLSALHAFPFKPKVHQNFLLYLYDIPGTGDNQHLFRQKINN